jgi:hypothetical protein
MSPIYEDIDFTSIALNNKRFDILQNCFQANKPAYLTLAPKKTSKEGGKDKNGSNYRDL